MAYLQATRASENSSAVANWSSHPFVTGYHLIHGSVNTLSMTPGAARAYANDFVISNDGRLPGTNGNLQLDTTVVGLGGCSPVLMSEAAPVDNTSFGVYVLGDTSGARPTAVVIATGDDFMPEGYDAWRRVGMVQNVGGTDDLVFMEQNGLGTERAYHLQSSIPLVVAGNFTGFGIVDMTSGNAPCHPELTSHAIMSVEYTPALASNLFEMALATAPAPTTWPVRLSSSVDAVTTHQSVVMYPEVNQNVVSVYYRVANIADSVDINLAGFTESLSVDVL